ncbi:MAG TPA: DUF1844 domain-containing protein [Edaphobacter sp.]|nr:DUF1844 domain-containing protein [Edaphobacter sp.]
MSEQNKPFVVTDRRKFNLDGELRPDATPSPEEAEEREKEQTAEPIAVTSHASVESGSQEESEEIPEEMLAGPTEEQSSQAEAAYKATSDRLDTAIRAANPGADHPPAMSFETLVQSIYMTTIVQLGGATPEGQQPQVDLMGARQSIDMLGVLADKTKGNLSENERRLLESALFELRMGFLEITQALARSASAKAGAPGPGPSIVR